MGDVFYIFSKGKAAKLIIRNPLKELKSPKSYNKAALVFLLLKGSHLIRNKSSLHFHNYVIK